jgi:hypothetical protein
VGVAAAEAVVVEVVDKDGWAVLNQLDLVGIVSALNAATKSNM